MKKIISLLTICISSVTVFAQGNLKFNSVKYIRMQANPGLIAKDTTVSIPSGTTWKIESVSCRPLMMVSLDGVPIAGRESGYVSYPLITSFPIWLPSGTYTIKIDGSPYYSDQVIASFSIIEFLIEP